MAKFWDVARWFIDPVGSLGYKLATSGLNSDKMDIPVSEIKNTVTGAWNDWTGNTANRENIAYQQDYNQEVFNRADTQYQRAVASLRSAGLSPQLAAGTPSTVAGASAAPQRTVGNESAAIEKIVGLVNAIKSTNAGVALAGAQADEAAAKAADATASAGLKNKELEGFDQYRSMELAVMGSSVSLNNAYTRVLQIDGKYKAQQYMADIQNTMANTKYVNSLIDLADKNMKLVDAQISQIGKNIDVMDSQIGLNKANAMLSGARTLTEFATRQQIGTQIKYLNKEVDYLSSLITSEINKRSNLDADTKYTLQLTSNAALKYVIDNYTYQFKTGNGDSPDSTVLSQSQIEENKKAFKRELILSTVRSVTSVATGAAAGFMFTVGSKGGGFLMNKMLGMGEHKPWGLTH